MWWGIIVEATNKFPLGAHPKEAFETQLIDRYGKGFDALISPSLEGLLNEIGGWLGEFLEWLYPHHFVYHEDYNKPFPNYRLRKTIDYARQLYHDRTKHLTRDHPKCCCGDDFHIIGAFKYDSGTMVACRFCERCGSKSQAIRKKRLPKTEIKNACEWVAGRVNFDKTDFRTWKGTP